MLHFFRCCLPMLSGLFPACSRQWRTPSLRRPYLSQALLSCTTPSLLCLAVLLLYLGPSLVHPALSICHLQLRIRFLWRSPWVVYWVESYFGILHQLCRCCQVWCIYIYIYIHIHIQCSSGSDVSSLCGTDVICWGHDCPSCHPAAHYHCCLMAGGTRYTTTALPSCWGGVGDQKI